MKKLIIGLIVVLSVINLFTSCAKMPKVQVPEVKLPVAGPLSQIVVTPGSPKIKVGENITLTAKGYDKDGKEVSINPTWKCGPEGRLQPTVGTKVTFTAVKQGVCFIDVIQDNVSTTVAVEIK
ncbi:MAG: hypothetical protein RMJ13_07870 [Elusimicrobiota bacterium]|nr:hypothetical protein [Elusimicrobiota bacterium]